ncbi:NlpC/P60 family protein [Streptomyces sp. MMS24-I31]|uniref:C40 family peptidase n=1 Tax=Streptomyces sp. MMS24-I31 TaxID=3351563 RepID=UPI003896C735
MASHRKTSHPVTRIADLHAPALAATAARTSVALFSQTTAAAPAVDDARPGGARPSPEEVEKKIDDLYRRAESAAESAPERQDTARERAARRTDMLTKAREMLGAFTAAQNRTGPDTPEAAASLLAETPQGYFDQSQVMSRLTARRKSLVEGQIAQRSGTRRQQPETATSPEPPSGSPHDIKAAKAAVQRKLAAARELLANPTDSPSPANSPLPTTPPLSANSPLPATPPLPTTPPSPATPPLPTTPPSPATPPLPTTPPSPATPPLPTTPPSPATPPLPTTPPSPATPPLPTTPPSPATPPLPTTPPTAATPPLPTASPSPAVSSSSSSSSSDSSCATQAERALAFARAQIGKPYVWGAVGPGSYDNSGLVQAAWKAAGVTLPRRTHAQARTGRTVPLSEALPGDLVFFHDDAHGGSPGHTSHINHVGVYTGDGLMIHAPRPGTHVREEPVHHNVASVVHSVVRPA